MLEDMANGDKDSLYVRKNPNRFPNMGIMAGGFLFDNTVLGMEACKHMYNVGCLKLKIKKFDPRNFLPSDIIRNFQYVFLFPNTYRKQ